MAVLCTVEETCRKSHHDELPPVASRMTRISEKHDGGAGTLAKGFGQDISRSNNGVA